jgi:serine/threonine protein kinase
MHGYEFIREVGKGAMSRVYLAMNKATEEPVAAKVYNNQQIFKPTLGGDEPASQAVQREVDLMASVQHRHVLPLIDFIQDDATNSTILVMPFAERGTLQTLVDSKALPLESLPICFLQIAEAMRYLHSQNIVHRDLKPDNVLCFELDYFVVTDFSVSRQLDGPGVKLEDTRGSPAFLSPEECSGKAYDPKPADVWAFGISLFATVFGRFPFNLDSAHGRALVATIIMVKELIEKEDLVFPDLPAGVDETVVPLIRATLDKNVDNRPTFEAVLKFDFFREAWAVDERQRKMEEELRRLSEEEERREKPEDGDAS